MHDSTKNSILIRNSSNFGEIKQRERQVHETFQLCVHFTYFVDRMYDIIQRTGTLPEFNVRKYGSLSSNAGNAAAN
jgi:hypothetical protein